MEVTKEFGIQWPLLVASVINFFILLYLLKKLLYKPILKMLDERKETIAKSLENAEKIEQEKQKTEERMKASLKLANDEATKIIGQAHKIAEKTKADIMMEAEAQAEKMLQRARAEIAQEREQTSQAIKKETASLVAAALKSIAKESGKLANEDKLIQETLETIQ